MAIFGFFILFVLCLYKLFASGVVLVPPFPPHKNIMAGARLGRGGQTAMKRDLPVSATDYIRAAETTKVKFSAGSEKSRVSGRYNRNYLRV